MNTSDRSGWACRSPSPRLRQAQPERVVNDWTETAL